MGLRPLPHKSEIIAILVTQIWKNDSESKSKDLETNDSRLCLLHKDMVEYFILSGFLLILAKFHCLKYNHSYCGFTLGFGSRVHYEAKTNKWLNSLLIILF